MARLNHLLERSTLYTQFLYQRMQSQKARQGSSAPCLLRAGERKQHRVQPRRHVPPLPLMLVSPLTGGGTEAQGKGRKEGCKESREGHKAGCRGGREEGPRLAAKKRPVPAALRCTHRLLQDAAGRLLSTDRLCQGEACGGALQRLARCSRG